MVLLEVPIFGSASAETAISAGASRIELNASGSYPAGGLTPSLEELAELQTLEVPIRVMIRSRGPPISSARDFIYLEAELEAMERSIHEFKSSGLLKEARGDGFVFGALREIGDRTLLNVDSCKRFTNAAKPFKTVFHRAFDELVDSEEWQGSLDELVHSGIDGILTSGGPGNAVDNINRLDRILEEAGNRIEIILGGGVRSSNAGQLSRDLQLSTKYQGAWVHSSCLIRKDIEVVDGDEVGAILAEME